MPIPQQDSSKGGSERELPQRLNVTEDREFETLEEFDLRASGGGLGAYRLQSVEAAL